MHSVLALQLYCTALPLQALTQLSNCLLHAFATSIAPSLISCVKLFNAWRLTLLLLLHLLLHTHSNNSHKEQKSMFLLSGVESVTARLDDSLVSVTAVLSSPYAAAVRSEAEALFAKLQLFESILKEWLKLQRLVSNH
jgi:Dynein heavy chain, N-terminal region 2